MPRSGIPEGFKVATDEIPEPIEPEVVKNANSISDKLRDSGEYSTFYRVREVWTGDITVKPQKFVVRRGAKYYLVSDDGEQVYDDKGYHEIGLVFRDYNGKRIYAAQIGSKIALIDGKGNAIGPEFRYHEFEYLGNGAFKTGTAVRKHSKEIARFYID